MMRKCRAIECDYLSARPDGYCSPCASMLVADGQGCIRCHKERTIFETQVCEPGHDLCALHMPGGAWYYPESEHTNPAEHGENCKCSKTTCRARQLGLTVLQGGQE